MSDSLYQRLGGAERIAAVVDDAFDRHAVNPLLAPRFRGKDLPRLKLVGTQFFCAGSGGPQKYEGRDLRTTHAGMNANEQERIGNSNALFLSVAGLGPALGAAAAARPWPW